MTKSRTSLGRTRRQATKILDFIILTPRLPDFLKINGTWKASDTNSIEGVDTWLIGRKGFV